MDDNWIFSNKGVSLLAAIVLFPPILTIVTSMRQTAAHPSELRNLELRKPGLHMPSLPAQADTDIPETFVLRGVTYVHYR